MHLSFFLNRDRTHLPLTILPLRSLSESYFFMQAININRTINSATMNEVKMRLCSAISIAKS